MGFIGIDRGLRDHWIYQDAEYLKVWMEMLFLARFSEEPHNELIDGDLVTVSYGQFIYGRVKWSERLKISEQRLRTLIIKLKKAKMIDVVDTYRKCSVYEVLNYAKFNHQSNHHSSHTQQGNDDDANHHGNQLPTISQPSANHQLTTKEQGSNNDNKVKKENKYKELVVEIINYLNEVTGKSFSSETKESIKLISGRLTEGRTIEQFRHVIDVKASEWLHDEKMNAWLKPNTLFAQSNFESYMNQKLLINGGGNREITRKPSGKPIVQGILPDNSHSNRLTEEELAAARAMADKLDQRFNKGVAT